MSDDELQMVETPCSECGDSVEIAQPRHTECDDYDYPDFEDLESEPMVPVSEMEELVEDWREKADTFFEIHDDDQLDMLGEVSQIEILADELEALYDE